MPKTKKAVEVEENLENEKEAKLHVYEVGYLMIPSIPEENLGEEVTSLKDALSEKGAIFISDEYPKLIELAYEMFRSIASKKQKFSYGYFGWVKFECTKSEAREIKNMLDKSENLIRFLLIKTVRENTMSIKRSYGKQDGSKRRSSQRQEKSVPINEETLNKEIDALVVE